MAAENLSPAAGPVPIAAVPPAGPAELPNVYDYFIGSDEDVVGLVAYAIYKQEKREWLATWRRQNNAPPSVEHFNAFVSANLTPGQRHRYRNAARQVLEGHIASEYEGAPANGRSDHDFDRLDIAMQRETRTGWLQSLSAGAVGAAVVVIAFILMAFLLRTDLLGLLGPAGTAQ